jgi:hypothetical protein
MLGVHRIAQIRINHAQRRWLFSSNKYNRSAFYKGLEYRGMRCLFQPRVARGFAWCALACLAGPVSAQPWGANLIVNGCAENGAASPDGQSSVTIPGWSTWGSMTVVPIAASPIFPQDTTGLVVASNQFFAGGATSPVTQSQQTIDLAAFAPRISQGGARFELFASLGGYSNEDDTARMVVVWLDAAGQSVRTDTLLGPNSIERNGQTKFVSRRSEGVLPASTASARVVLLLTRVIGPYNNAYADDLRVTLYPGPCTDVDINNDTVLPDDRDIIDFFTLLAGGTCAECDSVDFNKDTVFPDDRDIVDFFTVLAGGVCGDA